MKKQAVSVTLAADNLLWLRGQARAAGARSLSAVLDAVVSKARSSGQVHEAAVRSVVGTVQISEADPELLQADAAIRALFPAPRVHDGAAVYGRRGRSGAATRRGRRR